MSLAIAEKKVSLKKTVYFVIVLCAVCSLVSGALVYAYSPGNYQVISGGIYPGASTYTMFADDGTYYAKNAYGLVSYSGTNATTIINQVMSAMLVSETGGKVTVVSSGAPMAFTLGYIANNTELEGIGEIQITSTNGGADEFIMREGATMTNCFLRQQGNTFVDKYESWSPYYARLQHWSDFPSEGGDLYTIPGQTTSTYLIMDGPISTEGEGEVIVPFVRFYPTGASTYALRMSEYGELLPYNLATGEVYHVYGQASITGAVNSVTVNYTHSYVLGGTIRSVTVTPQQVGQGLCWASAWTATNVTIAFETQPGASTWYFFFDVYSSE